MTDWLELFKIEKEKSGVKAITIISINAKHEGDWIEQFKDWIKRFLET